MQVSTLSPVPKPSISTLSVSPHTNDNFEGRNCLVVRQTKGACTMSNTVAELFNVRSHNPSFFSVQESAVYKGPLVDFCIPVNLHFPPPQLVQRIGEHL